MRWFYWVDRFGVFCRRPSPEENRRPPRRRPVFSHSPSSQPLVHCKNMAERDTAVATERKYTGGLPITVHQSHGGPKHRRMIPMALAIYIQ